MGFYLRVLSVVIILKEVALFLFKILIFIFFLILEFLFDGKVLCNSFSFFVRESLCGSDIIVKEWHIFFHSVL